MDFFASQDQARKRSSLLVFYYILAVIMIIFTVYLALAVGFGFAGEQGSMAGEKTPWQWWHPELFLWVVTLTLFVVVAGTIYKVSQLAQGGAAVAALLGGRQINRNNSAPLERRLLNVVDEMAIASGTAVPEVYLLDQESGINAFAAGFTPNDAVIAVTMGAAERLSREELQGVVAHEFSHIINGDMRLNIRLTGVLHGILLIGLIGYFLFRTTAYSGGGRSRRDGRVTLALLLFGLTLMVIGFVGVFFGKLIKSAVSRQREYLADASSVQFTRNPAGLAGALKKIGGFAHGSRVNNSHSEEASHFFFANGLQSSFLGMLSTHPPLDERIRRIDKSFSGDYVESHKNSYIDTASGVSGFAGGVAAFDGKRKKVDADEVLSLIGAPQPEHILYARALLNDVPKAIRELIDEPFGARAVIYGLLLSSDNNVRQRQLSQLADSADNTVFQETEKCMADVGCLDSRFILPVVDLAISSLRELSERQFEQFEVNVKRLVEADNEIDLFEFTLQRIMLRHLVPKFRKVSHKSVQFYSVKPVISDIVKLISCLAYWGANEDAQADPVVSFSKAMDKLGGNGDYSIAAVDECGLGALEQALARLVLVTPFIRKRVIGAAVACIAADGYVTLEEAELLRAIADSLDCPVPPLFAGAATSGNTTGNL